MTFANSLVSTTTTMEYCCSSFDTTQNPEAAAVTIEESLQIDTGHSNGASYKIKQLFNRHGYNLAILRGHVKGEQPKGIQSNLQRRIEKNGSLRPT